MSDDVDFDFDIDFGNVKEFEALPTGDYVVLVSDAVVSPTKAGNGKFNLVLSLEVEEPVEFNGRSFKSWVYIDPENPWGLKAAASAILRTNLDSSFSIKQMLAGMVGERVGVTMEEGEYDGKPTSNVKAWFPYEG